MADPENKFAGDFIATSEGVSFFQTNTPDEAMAEATRRQAVRSRLLQEARENFDSIAGAAETPYSRNLREMQVKLNAYLRQDPSFYSRAIVFDRAKMDAAMAIGFGEIDAVKRVLAREGLRLGEDASDNLDAIRIAGKAVDLVDSRFGLRMYTQNATSLSDVGQTDPAYVIVPEPDHAQGTAVKGLTPQENTDFTNRHETWHAKDSRYSLKGLPPETVGYSSDYHAKEMSEDPELRQAFVTRFRKEALADTGALGDMIRDGGDFSTLEKVSTWRTTAPDDSIHFSPAVLSGLKAEIEAVGLDRFRGFTDREAKAFYYNVVEKYGISEKSIEAAAHYDMAAEKDRAAIEDAAAKDPEIRKGLAFRAAISVKKPEEGPNILSEAEAPLKAQLDAWKAEKILQDRAFALDGRVTPASLIRAYGALETELHDKMKSDAGNSRLYDLQMSKLQTTFIEGVQGTDYVEVNRQRGVKIEEVEPALSQFMTPVKIKDAETASPAPSKKNPTLKL